MGAETTDRRPKGIQVTIAKEHLGCFNQDDNRFLNFIVTGDDIWVHYAEPETKASQSSGKELVPHLPKSLSCLHLLAKLCWVRFGIHVEYTAHFMPKGQTVTARYCSEVILKNPKTKTCIPGKCPFSA